MSDSREALRRHFEVDAENVAIGALDALGAEGKFDAAELARAISELGVDVGKLEPASL
jgi:pyruvate dehydrogenase E1 component